MCQKAFGSFFGPLVAAHGLEWTRGKPRHFASSNLVRRGFCGECGTPLTYEYEGGIEVAIGALDDPEKAAPVIQLNPAGRLSFMEHLSCLPWRRPRDNPQADIFLAEVRSRQHPDHDTQEWPSASDGEEWR
jgi:hypothetical protein